jgi:RIO kinase 1
VWDALTFTHRRSIALSEQSIEHFRQEGLIEDIIRPLKQGKEASVHLCRSDPGIAGHRLTALKIYHPLDRRDFRDEKLYRDGEFIKERRVQVALEQRTRFGRQVQGGLWVSREWETLRRLEPTRVPAPAPIASTDDAILMTYVGDSDEAAPRLKDHRPDRGDLGRLWVQVLSAVEHMLFHDIVHADLSPYNLLVWDGDVTVIDFPQAVDAKKNRHAEEFLVRDVNSVGAWFGRHGLSLDWDEIGADLWASWQHADLLPDDLRFDVM